VGCRPRSLALGPWALNPRMRVLQTLGLPEHPKTKGESPVLTKAGYHPPLENSGWESLTYTSGPPIEELNVDPASYPQGQR